MLKPSSLPRATGAAVAALVIGLPAALQAGGDHGRSFGHPGTPQEVDRTVRVEAKDLRFSRAEIPVEPGQTVRFVVTNTGDTQHEFTIGPPRVQRAHRREMRKIMGETHGSEGHHGPDGHHADDGHHSDGGHHGGQDGHHGAGGHHGDQAGTGGQRRGEMDHDHPNSVMVQPGRTKELIWHFAEVDQVRFGCNVPGHYQAGMHGPFVRPE